MILKSMTEFVFMLRNRTTSELCKDFPRAFTLPVYNGNQDDMVKAMLAIDAIQWKLTGEYAKFLIKKLELWMFVPCDKDGNFLEEPDLTCKRPESKGNCQCGEESVKDCREWWNEYQVAKQRVLFEGFEYVEQLENKKDKNVPYHKFLYNGQLFYIEFEGTIERIVEREFELTQTAQKLIGL
jgi:hypothetical protein